MFNRDDLQKLVNIAGHSLEIEDRFITGRVVTNPELYRDMRPGGILRINNERYYQFLITRNLMSGLPYRVDVERATHDLVLYTSSTMKVDDYAAVGELKRWMSPSGKGEIPAMQRDIDKLRPYACPTFLLIVTNSEIGKTDQQKAFLANQLQLDLSRVTDAYVFRTSGTLSSGT